MIRRTVSSNKNIYVMHAFIYLFIYFLKIEKH